MNEICQQCKTNTGSPYAFYYGVTITSNVQRPVSVSLCQECVKKQYKRDLWLGLVGYLIMGVILLPLGSFILLNGAYVVKYLGTPYRIWICRNFRAADTTTKAGQGQGKWVKTEIG